MRLTVAATVNQVLPSSVFLKPPTKIHSRNQPASPSTSKCSRVMGRLSFDYQSMTFEDAFHEFKAKEYVMQKDLVDAVLLSNFALANKLKMELHTYAPCCSDDIRALLEKSRGKFIGQCFFHTKYGYRGIIFKPDYRCRMDDAWVRMMGVQSLERGVDQPFYHCLVDIRDRPGGHTTYVAEDNITPSIGAFNIQHPLLTSLFTPVPELKCYVGTDRLDSVLIDYDD